MRTAARRAADSGWLYAAYAILVFSSLKSVANPDVFWHLSAGARVAATGVIPRADFLSFSRAGAPWVDFEWLSQLIFWAAHRAASWWGLIALKVALVAGSALIVDRALGRAGLGAVARACGVLALAAAWSASNDVRPDWFSTALLCLELAALEQLRRSPRPPRFWALALGAFAGGWLWACLHAGFIVGLAAASVYAALCPRGRRAPCAILLLAGLAGTLATPLGPAIYDVVASHAAAAPAMARNLQEWRPSTPRNHLTWPTWILLAACAGAFARARPRRSELAPWAALAGFAAMAVLHQRNIPFFAAAAVLLAGLHLADRELAAAPRLAAPVCALLAAAFFSMTRQALSRSGLREEGLPAGAAAFLEAHPQVASMRLYNPWNWGGYLGWRLQPPYRVFMDGRYLFHDQLDANRLAWHDPLSWRRYVEENALEGALLEKGTQPDIQLTWKDPRAGLRTQVFPYYVVFLPPDEWKLVYEDALSVIFLRRRNRSQDDFRALSARSRPKLP